MTKQLYQIYHANLAFSAIPEDELSKVIQQTYYPLLDFIEQTQTKIALEISAYSLEIIQSLHPDWLARFKKLHSQGLVELIGSGYMQIIAPLIPYEVNLQNQQIGLEVYKNILGITPNIVYVNEQTFSNSLVDLYHEVGYKALIMEWNNSYSLNKLNWKKEYAYTPILVKGLEKQLPIIWSDSLLFQQFQRFVHHETSLEFYDDFFSKYISKEHISIPIYTSDLEIFNYRPGRFETEAIIESNEWENIKTITNHLKQYGSFVLPHELIDIVNTNIVIQLSNSITPIIVKKQGKYSLSRWGACGRGANYINTLCYQYFKTDSYNIKKLLQYWGSDYRTHITLSKWNKAIIFLTNQLNTSEQIKKHIEQTLSIKLVENRFQLIFEKDNFKIIFNRHKGLTLKSIHNGNKLLQFGTVKHGDLDYIDQGADFYTGTTVIESALTKKLTNLSYVSNYEYKQVDENIFTISNITNLKDIACEYKTWLIDLNKKTLTLNITLKVNQFIQGSIRLGLLTLMPQNNSSQLWYECKNGGNNFERYHLIKNIDHQKARSLIQSSSSGLGVTDGILRFGDNKKTICEVKIDQTTSYPFIMLQHNIDNNKSLTRVFFSVQELDDTLKESYTQREFKLQYSINIK